MHITVSILLESFWIPESGIRLATWLPFMPRVKTSVHLKFRF